MLESVVAFQLLSWSYIWSIAKNLMYFIWSDLLSVSLFLHKLTAESMLSVKQGEN